MESTDHSVTVTKEAQFDISELFFSITDKESKILAGNDTFVRISGYTKAELIGQYHNIIRHPDMPRIIFKTLWDYLNAGKPIVAYVKNKTKTGEFYWVLGAVFPLGDRYVSIRLKPNSKLFGAVKELYAQLLRIEGKEGMGGSQRILPELLHDAGYVSYDHFMSDALLQELEERGALISQSCISGEDAKAVSPELAKLRSVHEIGKTLMQEYDRWFEKIDMFIRVKTVFEEKGMLLRHLARDIVFLSLNASVSSYKVENGGETFAVLAHDIRITAKENDTLIHEFHTIVHTVTDALHSVVFAIAAIRFQIEMVTYFIEEVICKNQEEDIGEMYQNISDLITLVDEYTDKAKTLQADLDRNILESNKYLDQMEQQMMYLGYVQTYGIIEAAGNQDETVKFGVIFSQLKALIAQTSSEVATMQKMGKTFYAENRVLMNKSKGLDVLLQRINEEMKMIKKAGA